MPKVSVIIPVYNEESYVAKAIESVLCQKYTDFEIIVVNDGSTDNTEKEILKFKDGLIYLKQKNMGRGAARNAALKLAQGEYIAFLDADDEWCERKLSTQVKYLDKHREFGLVYTDADSLDQNNKLVDQRLKYLIPYEGDVFTHLIRNCFITTSGVLLRHDCLKRVGLFDESLKRSQDYDLWLRLSLFIKFAFLPGHFIKYRGLKNWLKSETRLDSFSARIRIFDKLKRNYPSHVKKLGHFLDLSYSFVYESIGHEYLKMYDLHNATNYYHKAHKHFPQNLPLQQTRSIVSYLAGQTKEAKSAIRRIIKKDPYNSKMLFYLGCCYFKEGDYKKAEKVYKKTINSLPHCPFSPETLNNLGLASIAQKDYPKANHWLENALNQKTDYQDAAANYKLCQKKVKELSRYRFTEKLFGRIV